MDCHGNQLAGNLPDLLVPNDVLQFISLYDNSFTGALPRSWGTHLSGVFHLDLSLNKLEGDMPSSIGNMAALLHLFLGNNDWTPGPIPSEWSNLIQLQEFSVKGSQRTGHIPDLLTNFPQLIFLDLDDNELEGTIPTELGSLVNLEFLLLNRNRLIGAIPPELSQLTKLRAAFLEGNYLVGDAAPLCGLPHFVDNGNGEWALLVTDCQGDDSTLWPVECECCALCCNAAPLHHQSQQQQPQEIIASNETQNDLPANGTSSNNNTAAASSGVTESEKVAQIVASSRSSRPTCHDWTGMANINPRWETVYERESYVFGEQVWFDKANRRKRL